MNDFPANERWLIILLYVVLTGVGVILLLLVFSRVRYVLRRRHHLRFTQTASSLMADLVNHEQRREANLARIKGLARRPWQRQILLDMVAEMCYNFTGSYFQRSRDVFYQLGLLSVCQRKLRSRHWNQVVEGIAELSVVEAHEAYALIEPLLDHPHLLVRRQARLAVVELGKVQGLMAMERRLGVMSEWTFISILALLHRSAFKLSPEQLQQLQQSKNPSARRLAQRLDRYSVIY